MSRLKNSLPKLDNFWGLSRELLNYEFKATINAYLADAAPAVKTRNLTELIAFNKANADIELALFDQSIFEKAVGYGSLTDADYIKARTGLLAAARTDGIDALLADNNVEILVAPSGPIPGRVDPINGDVLATVG